MKDFSPFGPSIFGKPIQRRMTSLLAQRFFTTPFSVLSSRNQEWMSRKNAWIKLGIQPELGREEGISFGNIISKDDKHYRRGVCSAKTEKTSKELQEIFELCGVGASIFDPVLCETIYHWFTHKGAQIIDPFAGGVVRGIVAGCLGRRYWGCDLRPEQIEANLEQVKVFSSYKSLINTVQYVCGDSLEMLWSAPDADFVFSCPPYGDLEVYSDDPKDLSNMKWDKFMGVYKQIISQACQKLKPDRFACFVVSNFRDPQGYIRNFVGDTIQAFKEQGLGLYNEAIFVTPIGSAFIRASRQFESGRKLCKTHQNVLVFCKGDWHKASKRVTEKDV